MIKHGLVGCCCSGCCCCGAAGSIELLGGFRIGIAIIIDIVVITIIISDDCSSRGGENNINWFVIRTEVVVDGIIVAIVGVIGLNDLIRGELFIFILG